jgi:uncharacterized membrane protein
MMTYLLAFFIGVVAGLRAMTAPAAVSWAARLGVLNLGGSWLAFLGYRFTPWFLTALALLELVTDQLPSTPSRKVPMQFFGRVVNGAICGLAVGISAGSSTGGLLAGAFGAVVGTLAGSDARHRLALFFKRDRPAAVLEDIVAIAAAVIIIAALA